MTLRRRPQPDLRADAAMQERNALRLACRWGYDPANPATLARAIEELRRELAQADPDAPYRDPRTGPVQVQRRQDAADLLPQLEAIRHSSPINTESNSMKITDAFPSNYLKAADLNGRAVKVVINDCRMEDLDGESKPVLHFRGKQKGLVLNRINSQVLAGALGDETDDWASREVEIYPDKTQFQGRLVDCLRVRVPAPVAPADVADSDIPW